jgi:hypothetical protein
MRREDYEAAKAKNPDWDIKVAQDIKTWSKLFIFDSILAKREYAKIMESITKRVEGFVELVDVEDVKKKYRSDLLEYAEKVYQWTWDHFGKYTLSFMSVAMTKNLTEPQIKVFETQGARMVDLSEVPDVKIKPSDPSTLRASGFSSGTAGNMYYKDLQQLVKQQMQAFLDLDVKPTYYANVNPRNIAEMIVRFDAYKKQKQELINRGVRLVYVPPHSNCSKRCQPFQGKLYSLDGSSGTVDGKTYVPIEDVADNQTYTSKNTGRTYYNGLFAYNCRHTMQEYESGMVFEKIPDAVIEQQRDLEATQRRMEREYRALREKEELYRILGNRTKNKEILQIATQTRKKAVALRKNYEAFSRKHEITFYPNRLQIVAGENRYVRTVGKKDAFAKEALKMKNEA